MFNLLDIIIVRPIVNILFLIYSVVGDFGLAIILFTIVHLIFINFNIKTPNLATC